MPVLCAFTARLDVSLVLEQTVAVTLILLAAHSAYSADTARGKCQIMFPQHMHRYKHMWIIDFLALIVVIHTVILTVSN